MGTEVNYVNPEYIISIEEYNGPIYEDSKIVAEGRFTHIRVPGGMIKTYLDVRPVETVAKLIKKLCE